MEAPSEVGRAWMMREAPSEVGRAWVLQEAPSEVAGGWRKNLEDGVVEGWGEEWMRNPMLL